MAVSGKNPHTQNQAFITFCCLIGAVLVYAVYLSTNHLWHAETRQDTLLIFTATGAMFFGMFLGRVSKKSILPPAVLEGELIQKRN